ncbi:MAG: hypothetical protein QOF33_100 [Thermomicrobiales bacterium]|jgi:hypothetical protein|nr:hypothetical protein [Thermomicrobiales bacterium]
MVVVLESVDYRGRRILFTDDVWFDHILSERPTRGALALDRRLIAKHIDELEGLIPRIDPQEARAWL